MQCREGAIPPRWGAYRGFTDRSTVSRDIVACPGCPMPLSTIGQYEKSIKSLTGCVDDLGGIHTPALGATPTPATSTPAPTPSPPPSTRSQPRATPALAELCAHPTATVTCYPAPTSPCTTASKPTPDRTPTTALCPEPWPPDESCSLPW